MLGGWSTSSCQRARLVSGLGELVQDVCAGLEEAAIAKGLRQVLLAMQRRRQRLLAPAPLTHFIGRRGPLCRS